VVVEIVSDEMEAEGASMFMVTDQPGLALDDESIQLIATASGAADGPPWSRRRFPRLARAGHALLEDYRNFYSCESLTCLVGAFGAGALMANTGFDTTMQDAWLTGVEPTDVGTFFSGCKDIGEGRYAVPIFGTAAVAGVLFEGRPLGRVVGEWGSRSIRMFAVGAPPLYALQWATGASRPVENLAGSDWKPFQDANGVSGHAFVGAIPFLAAAEMVESPLLKGTLYVCSTFVGFSRMTTDSHYPSQVFLGWYLAWASARAVDATEMHFAGMDVQVVPLPIGDLGGVGVTTAW
jgi:membrane-associated phospholipid phosphatase